MARDFRIDCISAATSVERVPLLGTTVAMTPQIDWIFTSNSLLCIDSWTTKKTVDPKLALLIIIFTNLFINARAFLAPGVIQSGSCCVTSKEYFIEIHKNLTVTVTYC